MFFIYPHSIDWFWFRSNQFITCFIENDIKCKIPIQSVTEMERYTHLLFRRSSLVVTNISKNCHIRQFILYYNIYNVLDACALFIQFFFMIDHFNCCVSIPISFRSMCVCVPLALSCIIFFSIRIFTRHHTISNHQTFLLRHVTPVTMKFIPQSSTSKLFLLSF